MPNSLWNELQSVQLYRFYYCKEYKDYMKNIVKPVLLLQKQADLNLLCFSKVGTRRTMIKVHSKENHTG